MEILFIISHKPDNRYNKRIELLKRNYNTGIIYWNKENEKLKLDIEGVANYEIHLKANRTNPLKRIPQTLLFSAKAYKKLKRLKPKCIYVGNLDMLAIAARYKKKHKNVKIIYEIADLHRLIIDKQSSLIKKFMSCFLRNLEKKLSKYVDCLVLTSMKFYDVYYSEFVESDKVVFLPNMPPEQVFDGFQKKEHAEFTVGFIGWIRYKIQLKMLIDAAEKADVNVLFAGEDGDGNEFENFCSKYKHVTYVGKFVYETEIQKMYQMVDCIYAVYDADMMNVRIALPNKLYEAILCEMPIIVAKETYLSELVHNLGIGVSVNHKEKSELIDELKKLSTQKEYYDGFCHNCRLQKQTVNLNRYNATLLKKISEVMN